MCGIYAYSSIPNNGFSNDELGLLFTLSWLTSSRGKDSSGLCLIGNDFSSRTFKAVGGPEILINKTDWDAQMRPFLFKQGLALFGHGRAATRGSVNVKNAHPFTIDRDDKSYITLVHNGTLEYEQPFEGMFKHDVDSAWLAELIAKEGAKEVLPRVNGALALIWYDSQDNTMNFFRNLARPLAVAISPKGAFYVASEGAFLALAKHKHTLDFDYKDILEFTPMTHCKIDMATVRDIKDIDDVPCEEYQRVFTPSKGVRYSRPMETTEDVRQGYLPAPPPKASSEALFVPYSATDKDPRMDDYVREALSHRGYESDIIRISLMDIRSVEWSDVGDRSTVCNLTCVKNGGNYRITHAGSRPYRLGLKKIERADTGTIVLHYRDTPEDRLVFIEPAEVEKMKTEFIVRAKKRKWNSILQEAKKEDEKAAPSNVVLLTPKQAKTVGNNYFITQKMRPNATVKFHSKVADGTIKHKAKRTPARDAHMFLEYENDRDGKFNLGDLVLVEVAGVEPVRSKDGDSKTMLVRATKATSKMDSCIDYQFYISNLTAEEIEEFGLFEAKIAAMRLATKDEYKATGAVVIMLLGSPMPANWENNGTCH